MRPDFDFFALEIVGLVIIVLLVVLLIWISSSNGYSDIDELIRRIFGVNNDDLVSGVKIIRGIWC